MAFKIVVFFALASVAAAGVLPAYQNSYEPQYYSQPLVKQVYQHEEPANYEFNYDVHDPHTGDIKQQHEKAHDGAISGQYSLIDADGYRRIVDYTADDHHGFNAEVRREPVHGHGQGYAQQAIAIQKVIAQPAIAVQKYAAPVQHYSAHSDLSSNYNHHY